MFSQSHTSIPLANLEKIKSKSAADRCTAADGGCSRRQKAVFQVTAVGDVFFFDLDFRFRLQWPRPARSSRVVDVLPRLRHTHTHLTELAVAKPCAGTYICMWYKSWHSREAYCNCIDFFRSLSVAKPDPATMGGSLLTSVGGQCFQILIIFHEKKNSLQASTT